MTADTVRVWLIDTDVPADQVPVLEALLDPRERRRAAALTPAEERRRYTVTHAAVRLILGRHLGAAPGELAWRIGAHGKPELDGAWTGPRFSLSGSSDVAMLALSDSRRVGVDVQDVPASAAFAMRIAERYFPAREAGYVAAGGVQRAGHRFTALWVRKEACVKVTGGRLVEGLALPVLGTGARVRGGKLCDTFHVRSLRSPAGFRAALALEGAEPYRVTRHSWPGAGEPGP